MSKFKHGDTGALPLISATFGIVFEIARTLRTAADDDELRLFYADLMTYSLLVKDHLSHSSKAAMSLTGELVDSIITKLSGILTLQGPLESKLRDLNARWDEVRVRDINTKVHFIDSAVSFGEFHWQRVALIDFLATWESAVQDRYPKERSVLITEDIVARKRNDESPVSIFKNAQTVFKVMTERQSCECLPAHHFGARLCLGTYHSHNADDIQEGKVDFEMFLSISEDWQEVRVHTAKERAVQFALQGQTPTRQSRSPAARRVKSLCVPLIKAIKGKRSMRVELEVNMSRLMWLPSERSNRPVDLTKSPISLKEILQNAPQAFTGKSKGILMVMLSYAVLHLHDTSWLQPTWSSSDIVFFRTKDSEIPLRPFLHTHLVTTIEPGTSTEADHESTVPVAEDENDIDYIDPDDLSQHPFPIIVSLARLLMEVYFVTPFDDMARRYNLEVTEDASYFMRYIEAIDMLKARQNDMSDLFRNAIDNCLTTTIWENNEGLRLDSHSFGPKFYEEVVRPLETELSFAYSSISIENLDEVAWSLDFSNWDKTIRGQENQNTEFRKHPHQYGLTPSPLVGLAGPVAGRASSTHPHPSKRPLSSPDHNHLTVKQDDTQLPGIPKASDAHHKAARFFDDEAPRNGHTQQACDKYSRWKESYQDAYAKFITHYDECAQSTASVRIAVLDTGIDINHPDMQTCAENIKAKYNWLNEEFKHSVQDSEGHGTFVTSLLLDYAPDAHIYIAKIAEREPASPRVIAKAIMYAVDKWKIDVISMSFGFPTRAVDGYGELEQAIKYADYCNVLLFAAASNSGGQMGRAYPARDTNVVCVHSTDTLGNASHFNPTASQHDINLATTGECIRSAWPIQRKSSAKSSAEVGEGQSGEYAVKSGTSYATPIMAGIAAFLLLYTRVHLPDNASLLKHRSRMVALLRRIARKGQEDGLRNGYHFIDVSLYDDNLFGKDRAFIDQTIKDVLQS